MRRIARELTSFEFDPDREPVATVAPGERFVIETEDAHCGSIVDETVVYADLDEARAALGGANPVTGPVALEGLSAGHCMRVQIHHIDGAPGRDFGHMNTTGTLHPDLAATTTIGWRDGDDVVLPAGRGPVRVPYRPMIGTLGVAPATCSGTSTCPTFGPEPRSCFAPTSTGGCCRWATPTSRRATPRSTDPRSRHGPT
jgi:acetamidase/formamidase